LLLTLREWARRNPYKVHLRWVKGHQDEDTPVGNLSHLAKLNVAMDELADTVHDPSFLEKSVEDPEVLPAERWALFIGSAKVTTKLKDRVLHRCHCDDLVSYVTQRHSLGAHDMEHIAWSSLQGYLRKQKMARRAVVVKYLHGWLPTQGLLYKQGRADTDLCPVCELGSETQEHIHQCPHSEAVKHRLGLLSTFITTLQTARTAPEICDCWVSQLYSELGLGTPPASELVGTTPGMEAAVKEAVVIRISLAGLTSPKA